MTEAGKLFLIDGMALAYRAHFALIRNPRVTSTGMNTSAIFGFLNTIQDIITNREPTHLAVAFDTPEPTFRHIEYKEYKATRDAMPEDLSAALPEIFNMVEALNIPILRYPGFEADDVIGTLARQATEAGLETYMVTPDKDFAQLVSEHVYQYKPSREGVQILGVPEVLEAWGVATIEQVVDVLGLMGDTSDNVPGVPGVGPKTAKKLIAKYGSVEEVLAHIDELKGKQKENFENHRDEALMSKQLVTINTHVPLDHGLDDFVRQGPDLDRLKELFAKFEFQALGKRMFGDGFSVSYAAAGQGDDLFAVAGENGDAAPAKQLTLEDVKHEYYTVDSPAAIAQLATELSKQKAFCFDVETTGKDVRSAALVGIAFCWEPHKAWYVPLPEESLLGLMDLDPLRPVLADTTITKIGQNIKYDMAVLRWHDVVVEGPVFDTMLAHYLIDPEARHGMDYLSQVYLNYKPIPYSQLIPDEESKAGKTLRDVSVRDVSEYCCEDADVTLRLKAVLEPLVNELGASDLFDCECKLVQVLVDMEYQGIRLDSAPLAEFSVELDEEIEDTEKSIYEAASMHFNIDSPKQIGQVLFEVLELVKNPKKTKTGQYATNERVLQSLAGKHEIVRDILEYRQMRKLKTTYVDMLPESIHGRTGRIHTTFSQAVTATGRMASQNPNLQNIPIRTERGREIRKAFVPSNQDCLLLSADYSQIELRIIAEISGDEALVEGFHSGADIHSATAAKVFSVPAEEVTKEMRSKSKMVNYGIAYGISAFGLAQRLNISRYEAADIIESYFNAFPRIKEYMDKTVAFAREHGYVATMMGRRRYLRDINSRNGASRQAAERNAVNSPIQGTAADMIKVAMVRVQESLRQGGFKTKMLLQIHDELLFDLYRDEQDDVMALVKEGMEKAIPMSVPIIVDMGVGENWLEAH